MRPYLLNCEVGSSRKSVSSLCEQRSGTAAEMSRIPAEIVLGDQEAGVYGAMDWTIGGSKQKQQELNGASESGCQRKSTDVPNGCR